MVEKHKEQEPSLVEDVFPDRVKSHVLHQVMRRLLDDFISIKPLGRLLETLDEIVDQTVEIDELVDACKDRIGDIDEYQFKNFFWSV